MAVSSQGISAPNYGPSKGSQIKNCLENEEPTHRVIRQTMLVGLFVRGFESPGREIEAETMSYGDVL